ncbi:maleylacetoacetate isomerase [Salinihabitans flavidus]|uniref:Maleylacetoacetate isomerase n=1 Tax=Salinihabitans flavidus TaxID=569882 RepID=A0A1H8LK11_9RHOB|nr:maleylacetoacetate isomerase [Salinihabitans flavidus]SEO05490.1 maleylacetoacetate isomerase [Salinihabitans flavidus]
MDEIILYDYWRSSASYRLRIALNLGGIDYRALPVDLVKGEHKSPEHLARNPQGLVPVLEIDGHSFTQSLAILDYLDETRGLGLLPDDPARAAKVRALAHSVAVDVHPVCNLSVAAHVASLLPGVETARADWMRHFIPPGLRAFEALLADFTQTPFCTGAAPSLADICLMPQVYNALRWEADFSDCPRIRAVAEACNAHPAFIAAHPDAVRPG